MTPFLKKLQLWTILGLKIRLKIRPKLRGSAELNFCWFGRSLIKELITIQFWLGFLFQKRQWVSNAHRKSKHNWNSNLIWALEQYLILIVKNYDPISQKKLRFWTILVLKIRPKLRPKLRGSAELNFSWFGRSLPNTILNLKVIFILTYRLQSLLDKVQLFWGHFSTAWFLGFLLCLRFWGKIN